MKNLILVLCLILPFLSCSQNPVSQLKKIIKNDDIEALDKFLVAGNGINECHSIKESSYSILVLSIKYGSEKVFAKCLELEADLNQICEDKTPLIYAIKYDKMEMFEVLLEKGADKTMKTKRGKTALQYAKKYERSAFIPKLQ